MIRSSIAAAFAALVLMVPPALAQTAAPSAKDPSAFKEQAPATYKVKFDTTKGPVEIQVTRAWAPNGADRFYNLVKAGYFDEARFFRVVPGFMVQFGLAADPQLSGPWSQAPIKDDPVTQSNKRGTVTFATSGPNSRTTQVFINFGNNSALDGQGFAPFGVVTTGMDVVDKLYGGYGDGAPNGRGPDQSVIRFQGNAYLDKFFPNLDGIKKATIE